MLITQNQLTAVYTGLKTVFQEGFTLTGSGIEDDWKQVALEAPSETEQEEYGFLRNMSNIREWIGDRYLQSLVEASYIIKNKHFEGTIAVPADKIADRKLASFNIPTKQLGQNARVFPNRLVFPLLAAGFTNRGFDGQYFFDANHPVMRPDGGTDLVSNNQGGTGPAWFLLDTTKIIKPVVYQNRHPLVKTGLPSAAVKAAVLAACNADRVRPLTDQVNVLDPVIVDYAITAQLTLFSTADAVLAQSEAQKAAEAYRDRQQARLGQDIVRTQIIEVLHGYGVYSVELPQPAADQVLSNQSWPRCLGLTITVAGTAQG